MCIRDRTHPLWKNSTRYVRQVLSPYRSSVTGKVTPVRVHSDRGENVRIGLVRQPVLIFGILVVPERTDVYKRQILADQLFVLRVGKQRLALLGIGQFHFDAPTLSVGIAVHDGGIGIHCRVELLSLIHL